MAKVKLNVPNVLGSNNNVEDTNMSNNEITIDDLVTDDKTYVISNGVGAVNVSKEQFDAAKSTTNKKENPKVNKKTEQPKAVTSANDVWFRTQLSSGKAPADYITGKLVGKAIAAKPELSEELLGTMRAWWDTPLESKVARNSNYNALVSLIKSTGIDVPVYSGTNRRTTPTSKIEKVAIVSEAIGSGIGRFFGGITGGLIDSATSVAAKSVTNMVINTENAIESAKVNHMNNVVNNFTVNADLMIKYQQVQLLKAQAKAAAKAAKAAAKSVDTTEKS